MGGQPWPELELHGPAIGSSQERGGEGGEETGARLGGTAGGAREGGLGLLTVSCLEYVRNRKKEGGRRKRRKEKEGKEKRK
jgi:hypothetical protein